MNKKVMLYMVFILIFMLAGCVPKDNTDNQGGEQPKPIPQPPPVQKDPIAEKIKAMTLEEKIGQMIMAGIDGPVMNEDEAKLIQDYHIGGFILFGRNVETPEQLLELTNTLKKTNTSNKAALLLSVDEEGGRISRLPKSVKNFPTNKALGKINSEELSLEVGTLLAEKVSAFGFNMNFAPVLDINSNPKNPVIGDRAFGSEVEVVRSLGYQTMKGISLGGVIPVVKHFPGHGDTSVDSHVGLPKVEKELETLKGFELMPFENAIDKGADCVMVAHILLTNIDAENPASLSPILIDDILRKQLNFEGVVITDDMTMAAVAKNHDLATAAVKAVKAGNDIILVAHKYENALLTFHALNKAVLEGLITEERIDQSVYRILALKEKYHLKDNEISTIDIEGINHRIEETLSKYK